MIGRNKIDRNCVFHELQQAALVSKPLWRFGRIKKGCNPGNKSNIRFKVSIKRIQWCLLKLSMVIKAARRVSFYSVNCCILIAFVPLLFSSMIKQGRPSSHIYQSLIWQCGDGRQTKYMTTKKVCQTSLRYSSCLKNTKYENLAWCSTLWYWRLFLKQEWDVSVWLESNRVVTRINN